MLKETVWYKKSPKSWHVINSAIDPNIMLFSNFSHHRKLTLLIIISYYHVWMLLSHIFPSTGFSDILSYLSKSGNGYASPTSTHLPPPTPSLPPNHIWPRLPPPPFIRLNAWSDIPALSQFYVVAHASVIYEEARASKLCNSGGFWKKNLPTIRRDVSNSCDDSNASHSCNTGGL